MLFRSTLILFNFTFTLINSVGVDPTLILSIHHPTLLTHPLPQLPLLLTTPLSLTPLTLPPLSPTFTTPPSLTKNSHCSLTNVPTHPFTRQVSFGPLTNWPTQVLADQHDLSHLHGGHVLW